MSLSVYMNHDHWIYLKIKEKEKNINYKGSIKKILHAFKKLPTSMKGRKRKFPLFKFIPSYLNFLSSRVSCLRCIGLDLLRSHDIGLGASHHPSSCVDCNSSAQISFVLNYWHAYKGLDYSSNCKVK